jgi:hypothetical protein
VKKVEKRKILPSLLTATLTLGKWAIFVTQIDQFFKYLCQHQMWKQIQNLSIDLRVTYILYMYSSFTNRQYVSKICVSLKSMLKVQIRFQI